MKLFRYDNFKLTISEEAYNIKPFRDIVNRDPSPDKQLAMLELGYVYFMVDPRSDYMYLTDTEERSNTIKAQEGLPEDWEPDELVVKALRAYELGSQTTTLLLLNDLRESLEKIRQFMKTLDLQDTDDKGKPKYPIQHVVGTWKLIPSLITQFAETERAIIKELNSEGRMKANKMKKIGEDGFTTYASDMDSAPDIGDLD